jgi:argininosuccinate lyase
VPIYTLTSGQTEVRVTAYGARLVSVRTPDRNGKIADVVLGYDDLAGYLADTPHLGSVVGRYGNRIALGKFSIDGNSYQIPINNGANALHGGPIGFDAHLWLAHELPNGVEFTRVSPNSLDAVADRDFVLDYLYFAAALGSHLSRIGAELALWASSEFGFVRLPDAFSGGSSIMPQKRNPDAAELMRAAAPRLAADLGGLLGVLHGLPLAYNSDLREDKRYLFDAVDCLDELLPVVDGLLAGCEFRVDRLAAACDSLLQATDVADYLVGRGVPFREAHHLTGTLVRLCVERNVALGDVGLDELQGLSPAFDQGYYALHDAAASLAAKRSAGGSAPQRVREQLAQAAAFLAEQAPPSPAGRQ